MNPIEGGISEFLPASVSDFKSSNDSNFSFVLASIKIGEIFLKFFPYSPNFSAEAGIPLDVKKPSVAGPFVFYLIVVTGNSSRFLFALSIVLPAMLSLIVSSPSS